MNFRALPPQLGKLDELTCDTLVLTHFADERPLQGLGGLVDWRLNGFYSRLLLDSRITGAWGELLLYPVPGRLPIKRLLYAGLGDRTKYGSTRFKEITGRLLSSLGGMGVASFAMVLPGREVLKLSPHQMIELWLAEFQKIYVEPRLFELHVDVTFLEPADVQAEIKDQVSQFIRQHAPPRSRG